jgi:hypothetical protein
MRRAFVKAEDDRCLVTKACKNGIAPSFFKETAMPHVALITLHGMGAAKLDYAEGLFAALRTRLGDVADQLDLRPVYYQDILKPNQEAVWEKIGSDVRLNYLTLRRFLLFGIGDAAGLENRKEADNSVYELAQGAIARQLLAAYAKAPDTAIVFLAQSLGGQVLSSYIYDAQKAAAGGPVSGGIWKDIDGWAGRVVGRALDDDEKRFLAGGACTAFVTTGCNIPIFVAAHRQLDIKPIARPTPDFVWINLYDPDDALGWPLEPLSPDYAALVEDREINVGHGVVNVVLKSWNPWSHTAYWSDARVLDALEECLRWPLGWGR